MLMMEMEMVMMVMVVMVKSNKGGWLGQLVSPEEWRPLSCLLGLVTVPHNHNLMLLA